MPSILMLQPGGSGCAGLTKLAQVVGLVALRGDRARVEERLAAVGRRADTEPAEVLVVEDDVLAARADQVRVVRVDAVGDDADLDAGPVTIWLAASTFITWRASGSTSGCAGLLGQICWVGPLATPWRPRWARTREGRAGPAAQRGEVPHRVGHHGPDRGVVLQPRGLGRGDRRGDRVDDVVAAHVGGVHLAQFGQHARLGRVGGLDPRVRGGALGGQGGELVLEDDDRAVGRVRRQALDLRGGEHGLGALEYPARRMGRYCRAAGGQRQQRRGP